MKPTPLTRVFAYAGTVIPDPNPAFSPEKCLSIIAASYPELLNAKIEPPKTDGGIQTFSLKVIADTKG